MPSKTPAVSRRSFLAAGAASAAAISVPASAGSKRPEIRRDRKPLNLIFLVSDGMSTGTLTIADLMIQELHGRRSHWWNLFSKEGVRRSMVETASANSMVTDSAAASTAWGVGERVFSGAIGYTPDQRMPEPILHQAKRAGKATGLVTTTTLSHATPAGWACNVSTGRGDESGIARNMMARNYDVLLGGGRRFYTDEVLALGTDYTKVFTRESLLTLGNSRNDRLVGVFNHGHLSYTLDRTPEEPTLAEMTRVAIERLSRNPDGFVMQVEGGRVDHAAHANDAGGLIHDQMAFDDALGVALEFAENRDDTLVIATTDHGNANPGLTQYLRNGRRNFLRLAEWKHSFEWMNRQLADTERTPEDHRRVIAEATTVELTDDELATVMRWRSGERVIPFTELNKDHGPLGSVLANHNGVSFISGNHTADHIEQTAIGPGAGTIPPILHLADMYPVMVSLLDLPPALPSV
ncbi:MAG: alkaline phosphatase [Phycisphaerales bacterium]|nr:alkaline phosphatase [Planctomycetota bacterium]MCH8508753.1 alkaline phosphatase [Phycisphaerales bacterium]